LMTSTGPAITSTTSTGLMTPTSLPTVGSSPMAPSSSPLTMASIPQSSVSAVPVPSSGSPSPSLSLTNAPSSTSSTAYTPSLPNLHVTSSATGDLSASPTSI